MSKAVFLRPHNIYQDYEGDWIQVDQKKIFVNAVSHKSLNDTIQGISNTAIINREIDNLDNKKIVTINNNSYYPLDLFKGSLILKAKPKIITKDGTNGGPIIFNKTNTALTYYIAYQSDTDTLTNPTVPNQINDIKCAHNFGNPQTQNTVKITNGVISGCKINNCKDKDGNGFQSLFSKQSSPYNKIECLTPSGVFKYTNKIDENDIDINSIHCDKCSIKRSKDDCKGDNCFWKESMIPGEKNKCVHSCSIRTNRGHCIENVQWNKSKHSDKIYVDSGKESKCEWIPNDDSNNSNYNSTQGICRPKNSHCYKGLLVGGGCGPDKKVKDGLTGKSKCVSDLLGSRSGITAYCAPNYELYRKHDDVYKPNYDICKVKSDKKKCNQDPFCTFTNKPAQCVSDGSITSWGDKKHSSFSSHMTMSDSKCNSYISKATQANKQDSCNNIAGCKYIPKVQTCTSNNKLTRSSPVESMFTKCKKVEAHVPANYNLNLVSNEGFNPLTVSFKNNRKYPYYSSAYLCDICALRNKDIEHIKKLEPNSSIHPYIIDKGKERWKQGAEKYCTRSIELDDKNTSPCKWKGGKCVSICSDKNPSKKVKTWKGLVNSKNSCLKHKWNKGSSTIFPYIDQKGKEIKDNYFKQKYCSWDGFECHNSMPCKDVQRIRCEDLGYDWYQGNAMSVDYDGTLDTSQPYEKKHDGNPIIGDTEGVCIFPNRDEWIGTPGGFVLGTDEKPNKYLGKQRFVIKWAEYGQPWWTVDSFNDFGKKIDVTKQNIYFLGEKLAVLFITIQPMDTPFIIKEKINAALNGGDYFVLNGDWIIKGGDVIKWIDANAGLAHIIDNIDKASHTVAKQIIRKDLKGIIDLVPDKDTLDVETGKPFNQVPLRVKEYKIDSYTGKITFKMHDNWQYQFMGIYGSEITSASPLYPINDINQGSLGSKILPDDVIKGYGTMYERYHQEGKADAFHRSRLLAKALPKNIKEITDLKLGNDTDWFIEKVIKMKGDTTYPLFTWENDKFDKDPEKHKELYKCQFGGADSAKICNGSIQSYKALLALDYGGKPKAYLTKNKITVNIIKYTGSDRNNKYTRLINIVVTGKLDQATDIRKANIWSMIRNTSPFWGNLSYGTITLTHNRNNGEYVINFKNGANFLGVSNFNKIKEADKPTNIQNNNTLLPLFDNSGFNWSQIMYYLGGNTVLGVKGKGQGSMKYGFYDITHNNEWDATEHMIPYVRHAKNQPYILKMSGKKETYVYTKDKVPPAKAKDIVTIPNMPDRLLRWRVDIRPPGESITYATYDKLSSYNTTYFDQIRLKDGGKHILEEYLPYRHDTGSYQDGLTAPQQILLKQQMGILNQNGKVYTGGPKPLAANKTYWILGSTHKRARKASQPCSREYLQQKPKEKFTTCLYQDNPLVFKDTLHTGVQALSGDLYKKIYTDTGLIRLGRGDKLAMAAKTRLLSAQLGKSSGVGWEERDSIPEDFEYSNFTKHRIDRDPKERDLLVISKSLDKRFNINTDGSVKSSDGKEYERNLCEWLAYPPDDYLRERNFCFSPNSSGGRKYSWWTASSTRPNKLVAGIGNTWRNKDKYGRDRWVPFTAFNIYESTYEKDETYRVSTKPSTKPSAKQSANLVKDIKKALQVEELIYINEKNLYKDSNSRKFIANRPLTSNFKIKVGDIELKNWHSLGRGDRDSTLTFPNNLSIKIKGRWDGKSNSERVFPWWWVGKSYVDRRSRPDRKDQIFGKIIWRKVGTNGGHYTGGQLKNLLRAAASTSDGLLTVHPKNVKKNQFYVKKPTNTRFSPGLPDFVAITQLTDKYLRWNKDCDRVDQYPKNVVEAIRRGLLKAGRQTMDEVQRALHCSAGHDANEVGYLYEMYNESDKKLTNPLEDYVHLVFSNKLPTTMKKYGTKWSSNGFIEFDNNGKIKKKVEGYSTKRTSDILKGKGLVYYGQEPFLLSDNDVELTEPNLEEVGASKFGVADAGKSNNAAIICSGVYIHKRYFKKDTGSSQLDQVKVDWAPKDDNAIWQPPEFSTSKKIDIYKYCKNSCNIGRAGYNRLPIVDQTDQEKNQGYLKYDNWKSANKDTYLTKWQEMRKSIKAIIPLQTQPHDTGVKRWWDTANNNVLYTAADIEKHYTDDLSSQNNKLTNQVFGTPVHRTVIKKNPLQVISKKILTDLQKLEGSKLNINEISQHSIIMYIRKFIIPTITDIGENSRAKINEDMEGKTPSQIYGIIIKMKNNIVKNTLNEFKKYYGDRNDDNKYKNNPERYFIELNAVKEPDNYNSIKNNPYTSKGDGPDCIKSINNIEFSKIQNKSGKGPLFVPFRENNVSDIFLNPKNIGCVRKDLTLYNYDDLNGNIHCNTNIASPLERDKHTMINYIISKLGLDPTDRAKLSIMNDEELINKAVNSGISIKELNRYTRPKIIIKERNIFNKTLTDVNNSNGKFEEWNDLEKKHYGNGSTPERPFLSNKEWQFVGCSIDLNDEDGNKSSIVCKDNYPSLCYNNIDKCESSDKETRKYMRENCPETCKVQYKNIKDLGGSGILSICSRQGRCKSPLDTDPSNLLPVCKTENVYKMGSSDKCANYLSTKLQGELKGKPCNSVECKYERCIDSGTGCVFEPGTKGGCQFDDMIDNKKSRRDCIGKKGFTWIGGLEVGSCIRDKFIDEENYTGSNGRQECQINGGKYISRRKDICYYNPSWKTKEDPCAHFATIDEAIKNKELDKYKQNKEPYKVEGISIDGNNFKVELKNNPGINFIAGDFIKIQENTSIGDIKNTCNPILLGNHEVIGSSSDNKIIINIKGKQTPYVAELSADGTWNAGDCMVSGHYRFSKKTGNKCVKNKMCSFNKSEGKCYSCSHSRDYKGNRKSCIGPNHNTSSCGWGNVRNVCERINEIEVCTSLYNEGCKWNKKQQRCEHNNLITNNEGCMKCNLLNNPGACHNLDNCVWDRTSKTHSCKSCTDLPVGDKCDNSSEGRCMSHTSKKVKKCIPAKSYPVFFDWIENNWVFIVLFIVISYIYIKVVKIIYNSKSKNGPIRTLLAFIITTFIFIISLHLLTSHYPVPSDYYKDINGKGIAPFKWGRLREYFYKPGNPSRWPSQLYDSYFDELIEDTPTLNKFAHFEFSAKYLSWLPPFYWFWNEWNNFFNSIQKDRLILKVFTTIGIFAIYYKTIANNKTNTIISDTLQEKFELSKRNIDIIFFIISIVIIVMIYWRINVEFPKNNQHQVDCINNFKDNPVFINLCKGKQKCMPASNWSKDKEQMCIDLSSDAKDCHSIYRKTKGNEKKKGVKGVGDIVNCMKRYPMSTCSDFKTCVPKSKPDIYNTSNKCYTNYKKDINGPNIAVVKEDNDYITIKPIKPKNANVSIKKGSPLLERKDNNTFTFRKFEYNPTIKNNLVITISGKKYIVHLDQDIDNIDDAIILLDKYINNKLGKYYCDPTNCVEKEIKCHYKTKSNSKLCPYKCVDTSNKRFKLCDDNRSIFDTSKIGSIINRHILNIIDYDDQELFNPKPLLIKNRAIYEKTRKKRDYNIKYGKPGTTYAPNKLDNGYFNYSTRLDNSLWCPKKDPRRPNKYPLQLLCDDKPTCNAKGIISDGGKGYKKISSKDLKSKQKTCNNIKDLSSCIKDNDCEISSGLSCPFDLPESINKDPKTGESIDISSSLRPIKLWKSIYSKYDKDYRNATLKYKDKTIINDEQNNIIYSIVSKQQGQGIQ